MSTFCSSCGRGLRSGAKFCAFCGRPTINTLPATESIIYVKCTDPECGVNNPEIAKFCLNCGRPIRSDLPLSKGNILQQRYEIVNEIGRGGQSTIYLAKDTRLNDREVAVKELLTGSLDSTYRTSITQRFHKEASTLANLKHINLPIILDFFSTDRGEYLVMEYIEGETLQFLSEKTDVLFSESQVLHWAGQLCKVLDYLHASSIIFQDLKPDNIMLDSNEVIKLIDFNIAKVFQEGKNKNDTNALGTPGYSAPEQYGGGRSDIRSDIFSLGITLFYLLTKYDPFMSPFNLPKVRNLNPSVSPILERVIEKAISLNPNDRFQFVKEMAFALDAVGNASLIERHPDWPIWEDYIRLLLGKHQRVTTSQLRQIPRDLRSSVIKKYTEIHLELDIEFPEDFAYLHLNKFAVWRDLYKSWTDLKKVLLSASFVRTIFQSKHDGDIENKLDNFVSELRQVLQLKMIADPKRQEGLSIYLLDVSDIFANTKIDSPLPLIVYYEKVLREGDLETLRNALGFKAYNTHNRIGFLLLFQEKQELEQTRELLSTKMKHAYAIDIIPLGYDELFKVTAAVDPKKALRSLVLSQVDLTTISPFVITGPVTETYFFGREKELRTIFENITKSSFVVVGGRRIGKSSLLMRLHKTHLPELGFFSFYFDCSTIRSYEEFLNTLMPFVNWNPVQPFEDQLTFADLKYLNSFDSPLILLFDEADKWVLNDREDWRIFSFLRSISNTGVIKIVFCGERLLRDATLNSQSPLFNFTKEILLGPLNYRAVEELIVQPFKRLEIKLVGQTQIVQQIWDFTSGHPNVVQRLCHRLIEQVNKKDSRYITIDDVDMIVNDPQFQLEDFLYTYWEKASPLECVTSLLMARKPGAYRLQSVMELLAAEGLKADPEIVQSALNRLVNLRSILHLSKDGYEFSVKSFPLVLAKATTSEDLLLVYKSQYLKNPSESVTII